MATESQTGCVSVQAAPGGYAESACANVARQCDQAIRDCWKQLGLVTKPPSLEIRINDLTIDLSNPTGQVPEAQIDGGVIVAEIASDAFSEPLEVTAVRAALAAEFGIDPMDRFLMVDGLAAYVYMLAQGKTALTAAESALARSPDLAAVVLPNGSRPMVVAALFCHNLFENFGREQIISCLKSAGAAEAGSSWSSAFGQPLLVLFESWVGRLSLGSDKNPFRELFTKAAPLYKSRTKELAALTILILATGLMMQVPAKFGAESVISVIQAPGAVNWSKLGMIAMVLVGSALASFWLSVLRAKIGSQIHRGIAMDLRLQMFSKLQSLSHSFYARSKTGDLGTRFNEDLLQVRSGLEQISSGVTQQVVIGIATGIHLFLINWILALAVLATVGAFSLYYPTIADRLRAVSGTQRAMTGEANSLLQESVSAHAVGKAFCLEGWFTRRMTKALAALDRAEGSLVMLTAVFSGFMAMALSLATVVAFLGAAILAKQGGSGLGDFATLTKFLALVPLLVGPATSLSGVGQAVHSASGSLARVNQILDAPQEIQDSTDSESIEAIGDIVFSGVTFGYEPSRPILSDLSLAISKGEFVAIVGESGSGKSTVTNLLTRFYDPDSGQILVDGHDIRSVRLDSLRSKIGLVFQDTFVFNSTLRENIELGLEAACEEDFLAASRMAEVDAFATKLPSGYETVLGERGSRLSGGQRQRIGLARALIRNPELLILDEATSALDPLTEESVLLTLRGLKGSRTIIMVTHRMESAKLADRVIVMDHGIVVEQGAPDDLMRNGSFFARMTTGGRAAARLEVIRKALSVYHQVPPAYLDQLAGQASDFTYSKGETVVCQGEPADALYVVLSGELTAVLNQGGFEAVVNTFSAGASFGESCLVEGAVRSATVRASTDVVVARISADHLEVARALSNKSPHSRRLPEGQP